MNEYIIKTNNPSAYITEDYDNVVNTGFLGEDAILDIMHTSNPIKVGDTLIGGWDMDGNQVETPNLELYKQIRPFGNESNGGATGLLHFHTYDGWKPRKLGSNGELYPPDIEPLDAIVKYKYFVDPEHPQAEGWGFRVELVGSAVTRNPALRAIGVYSDEECTQYLWTTGAFSLGTSEWQFDENNQPLQVWYTNSWDGDRLPDKKTWYISLLKASLQEGKGALRPWMGSLRLLFWDRVMGQLPITGTWTDTGATVTGQAGQLYYISDPAVVSQMVIGEDIRLGAADTKFDGVWAGTNNLIKINPFVQVAVGAALWRYI